MPAKLGTPAVKVDNDSTMAANSATAVASQQATKTADAAILTAAEAYTDASVQSLDSKPDVAYASTVALPANTYSNGSSGVGATLTGTSNGPLLIDSVTILIGAQGKRVLVAAEAAPANNGWYVITQIGTVAVSPYILTRATESDQSAEIGAGYITGVVAPNTLTPGTLNNGKAFISIAADPFTVGTTSLTFSQVGSTYSASGGVTLSGTTFSQTYPIVVQASTPLGSAASSITLTVPGGAPTNSMHIEIIGRGDTAANSVRVALQFNGSAASNYKWLFLQSYSGTPAAGPTVSISDTSATLGEISAASESIAAGIGVVIIDIPNYASTTFTKSFIGSSSYFQTSGVNSTVQENSSGQWTISPVAITSVTALVKAGNLVAGSYMVITYK